MPVSAETTFNEMSKCVQSWGKGCCADSKGAKTAATPAGDKKCCCTETDALGNKVNTRTNNSGKTRLGV